MITTIIFYINFTLCLSIFFSNLHSFRLHKLYKQSCSDTQVQLPPFTTLYVSDIWNDTIHHDYWSSWWNYWNNSLICVETFDLKFYLQNSESSNHSRGLPFTKQLLNYNKHFEVYVMVKGGCGFRIFFTIKIHKSPRIRHDLHFIAQSVWNAIHILLFPAFI